MFSIVTMDMISTSSALMPTAKAMAFQKLSSMHRIYAQKDRNDVAPPSLKPIPKVL